MRLPEKVSIIEVGPRDGFQNVKDFIETEDKLQIIELIRRAGVSADRGYFFRTSESGAPDGGRQRSCPAGAGGISFPAGDRPGSQ